MRPRTLFLLVFVYLGSAASFAQDWIEYVDRTEKFRINLPGEPSVADATYLGDNNLNPDETRTYAGIYLHAKRLYILEATVPPGYPPPLAFQQTLVILDEHGEQVRYALDADGQRVRISPGVE